MELDQSSREILHFKIPAQNQCLRIWVLPQRASLFLEQGIILAQERLCLESAFNIHYTSWTHRNFQANQNSQLLPTSRAAWFVHAYTKPLQPLGLSVSISCFRRPEPVMSKVSLLGRMTFFAAETTMQRFVAGRLVIAPLTRSCTEWSHPCVSPMHKSAIDSFDVCQYR